jgi:hypothetical protein
VSGSRPEGALSIGCVRAGDLPNRLDERAHVSGSRPEGALSIGHVSAGDLTNRRTHIPKSTRRRAAVEPLVNPPTVSAGDHAILADAFLHDLGPAGVAGSAAAGVA